MAKAPFKVKDIWALRVRLQMEGRVRDLALFNLGIDSKLRGCDLVALRVRNVSHGDLVVMRAIVMQHKTRPPAQQRPIEELFPKAGEDWQGMSGYASWKDWKFALQN